MHLGFAFEEFMQTEAAKVAHAMLLAKSAQTFALSSTVRIECPRSELGSR
jgi:hypothetical protein